MRVIFVVLYLVLDCHCCTEEKTAQILIFLMNMHLHAHHLCVCVGVFVCVDVYEHAYALVHPQINEWCMCVGFCLFLCESHGYSTSEFHCSYDRKLTCSSETMQRLCAVTKPNTFAFCEMQFFYYMLLQALKSDRCRQIGFQIVPCHISQLNGTKTSTVI